MTEAEIRKALEDARALSRQLTRKIGHGQETASDLANADRIIQARIEQTRKAIEAAQKDNKPERVDALREVLRILSADDAKVKDRLAAIRKQQDEKRARLKKVKARIARLIRKLKAGGVPNVPIGAFGVDFAWGSPSVSAFKAAGVRFVCTYFSFEPSKDLQPAEARAWSDAGVPIVVVWETTSGRALAGRDAGEFDARAAKDRLAACNPKRGDVPIYFAVDFDATETQESLIADYLAGAASILGRDRVGVYGSYRVVEYMLGRGVCRYAWQTYAWSGGLVSKRAHLLQYSNGHTIAGVSVDYDKSLKADFGQWLTA